MGCLHVCAGLCPGHLGFDVRFASFSAVRLGNLVHNACLAWCFCTGVGSHVYSAAGHHIHCWRKTDMVNMQQITDGAQSDTPEAHSLRKTTTLPCVGCLTRNLPAYVRNPPIEAVRPVMHAVRHKVNLGKRLLPV